jgi:hypothetical protein
VTNLRRVQGAHDHILIHRVFELWHRGSVNGSSCSRSTEKPGRVTNLSGDPASNPTLSARLCILSSRRSLSHMGVRIRTVCWF